MATQTRKERIISRNKLTPEQEAVLVDGQTEYPGSGAFLNHSEDGTYLCAQCENTLFKSDAKLGHESTWRGVSGWPAFSSSIDDGSVKIRTDYSHGMVRDEVLCGQCEGHLGHLFDDKHGSETGQHICVNSVALNFKGTDGSTKEG